MKPLQALCAVGLLCLLSACRKEIRKANVDLQRENSYALTANSSMFFPLDGAIFADLKTDITLSLTDLDVIDILKAEITVSENGKKIPGKTNISSSLVKFIATGELTPLKHFQVQAAVVAGIKPNDVRFVHVVGEPIQQAKDTAHLNFSWTFTTRGPYKYSMNRTSRWVTDFPRDGNKIIQVGDSLYSYGGWTSNPFQSYNDVYRSGGDLGQWERLTDAPWAGRHTYGIGKLDSTVFIFGGDIHTQVFDVWKTTDGVNFTVVKQDLTDEIGQRVLYGACVHNTRLYVLGGQADFEANTGYNDVWTGINGKLWTRVTDGKPFLGKNLSGAVASFNGRIWVIGGGYYTTIGITRQYTNDVYSSEDGIIWRQEKNGPWRGRQYADLCVWNNRLWMVGGYQEENLADIWYMTDDGEWHQLETPPEYEARHASGVGVYNDKLVIVCGNYHNDCWVIEKE